MFEVVVVAGGETKLVARIVVLAVVLVVAVVVSGVKVMVWFVILPWPTLVEVVAAREVVTKLSL